jgi:hypothetical protein
VFFRAAVRASRHAALERAMTPVEYDVEIAHENLTRICSEWEAARRRRAFAIVPPVWTGAPPTLADIEAQMLHVNMLKALAGGHDARFPYRKSA